MKFYLFNKNLALGFYLLGFCFFASAVKLDNKNIWVELPKNSPAKNLYLSKLSFGIENVVKNAKDAVLVVNTEKTVDQKMFNFSPDMDHNFDFFRFFGVPKDQIPKRKTKGQGSGFIIHPSGLAITNHHVVEGAEKIKIKVGSSIKRYSAKVIGSDELTDVALIQIVIKLYFILL